MNYIIDFLKADKQSLAVWKMCIKQTTFSD